MCKLIEPRLYSAVISSVGYVQYTTNSTQSILEIAAEYKFTHTYLCTQQTLKGLNHRERKQRGKAYLRCTQPTSLLINQ